MAGLREKQREQRREAILGAALVLFDSNGFSTTTVEQVAKAAGVSTPTVFNYFGNKQEILLALVDRADRAAISDIRQQLAHFDNAVDALCSLQAAVMRRELEALPLSIWREILAFGFTPGMNAVSQRLASQVADLLRELQGRGMLNQDFDAGFVADFLNDYCGFLFAKLIQQTSPDLDAHARQVRGVAEVLFKGLSPSAPATVPVH
ncbi:hypothetical protein BVH03_18725 [Pseudomonas sp. PA15(2017)]|uniref:TetR/AcrR family transcriptional regulator n=1 Tax=Pseudomonas sp. PA15(2017) TaxID=1932111 RepID=UPI0009674DD6|nr:TetR/AcrR family transcriptional regulator [Pseudomonas sp. PA15(2017)]OLU24953.1 hypothetical protein BVH03_18725 [Pseudomonas sp. PA15(2017)]